MIEIGVMYADLSRRRVPLDQAAVKECRRFSR